MTTADVTDDGVLHTGPVGEPARYRVCDAARTDVVEGGEGLLFRAIGFDGSPVALKLLTGTHPREAEVIARRLAPLASIDHPNVMRHREVFVGTPLTRDTDADPEEFDVVYTVADWVEGQSFAEAAPAMPPGVALQHVAGVARGLDALHRHRTAGAPHGVVHRDVKPSNVRITPDGRAVLVDFGVARPYDDDLTRRVGTYRWRAPEVLSDAGDIGTAVDAWGLGALAHWVLTGSPPALDGAEAARARMLQAARRDRIGDPAAVAGHIASMLEADPTQRPSDLGRWADRLDHIVRRTQGRVARRSLLVALISSVALLAALVIPRWGSRSTPTTVAAVTATAPPTAPPITTALFTGPAQYSFSEGSSASILAYGPPRVVRGGTLRLLVDSDVVWQWTFGGGTELDARSNCDNAGGRASALPPGYGLQHRIADTVWRPVLSATDVSLGEVGTDNLRIDAEVTSMKADTNSCLTAAVTLLQPGSYVLTATAYLRRATATVDVHIPASMPIGSWTLSLYDTDGHLADTDHPLTIEVVSA